MTISYIPLEITLVRRRVNREQLVAKKIISRATAAKFRRNAYVSLEVVDRLCGYLDCRVEDIVEYVPERET